MVEFKLTNSSHFGGNPYAGPWDDLPLPGGQKIRDVIDVQILRRHFAKMGIEGAHRDGKDIICERYRQLLGTIGNRTDDPRITAWLEQYKD